MKIDEVCIIDGRLICDYYSFIEKNVNHFVAFADNHWAVDKRFDPVEEEEDFYCEWIEELNKWLAGYLSEGMYEVAYKLMEDCA